MGRKYLALFLATYGISLLAGCASRRVELPPVPPPQPEVAWTQAGNAQDPSGKEAIPSGDTFWVSDGQKDIEVRLFGLACPIFDGSRKKGENQPYGKEARDFTAAFLTGSTMEVQEYGKDPYGLPLVVVRVDGKILNEELLREGFAWYSHKYCDQPFCEEWKPLEGRAKGMLAGLWQALGSQETPIAPWLWKEHQGKGLTAGKAVLGVGKTIGMFFGVSF
jgi:micrococcal nuclease